MAASALPPTKRCSRCGAHKPAAEFYPNARLRSGLSSQCVECCRLYEVARRERRNGEGVRTCETCGVEKPLSRFRSREGEGFQAWCIDCAPAHREGRSRRKRDVRARTISVKRMPKRELAAERVRLEVIGAHTDHERPRTRAECGDGLRPCPYVGCKFNLYLDVHPVTGAIKLNFPDLEPHELPESCALDVADRGGETLERVSELVNVTRERVRQIEIVARDRLRERSTRSMFEEQSEHGPLDLDDAPSGPRDLADFDADGLDLFGDLAWSTTPPGERER